MDALDESNALYSPIPGIDLGSITDDYAGRLKALNALGNGR